MKLLFKCLMVLTIFFCIFPAVGVLAETEQVVDKIDFSEIEKFVQQVDEEVQQNIPELSITKLYQDIKQGDFNWDIREMFSGLVRFFFKEVVANSALLTRLIVLAVTCVVLSNLQSAFDKGNVAILGHGVAYLVLITMALSSFTVAINTGKEAIENMVGFLYAMMPVLLTLLAAMGGVTSAALIHPAMLIILGFATTMIKVVIFPMIYFTAVLNIISHISPQFKVDRLAGLFKDVSLGLLGIVLTIFVGFLGMQGLAGSVADGLTIKAAKFASGAFIPIVGRTMADALDTVIGTSLILKNGVGFLGVIIIFLMCAIPAVKIMAMVLTYRIAAAVIQPFGDNNLAEALQKLGNSLTLVFATVAGVGLMFFFVITITVGTGNFTMMFR